MPMLSISSTGQSLLLPVCDVLTYRPPLVQTNPYAANVFICMSFFVALFNYIRFAREVIWQM